VANNDQQYHKNPVAYAQHKTEEPDIQVNITFNLTGVAKQI